MPLFFRNNVFENVGQYLLFSVCLFLFSSFSRCQCDFKNIRNKERKTLLALDNFLSQHDETTQAQHFESGSLLIMTLDKCLSFGRASGFLSFGNRELENMNSRSLLDPEFINCNRFGLHQVLFVREGRLV